jgi:predicted MPP superfamily phosphohydrolase
VVFILTIIGTMLMLDVLWLLLSLRLARGNRSRRWRWFTAVFAFSQIAGLSWIFLSRMMGWEVRIPATVTSLIYLWHFLGLAICIVVSIFLGVVFFSDRLRKRIWSPAPLSLESNSELASLSRRQFLGIAAAVTPPLLTVSMVGIARSQIEGFRVRSIEISIPDLPRDLRGLTIAHVSDMHIGPFTNGKVVRDIVESVNSLGADLVLLTGDLINSDLKDLPEGIEAVRRMEGRSGRWIIEGNHDLIDNGATFRQQMRDANIGFLQKETEEVVVRGQPIRLLGLQWVSREVINYDAALGHAVKKLAKTCEKGVFPILLSHHPHAFDAAASVQIPLTLSGHTHGGQLMLNEQLGCGPAIFRYGSGIYEKDAARLVVSNGVGNWFPLRVNAPAEILHLKLRRS